MRCTKITTHNRMRVCFKVVSAFKAFSIFMGVRNRFALFSQQSSLDHLYCFTGLEMSYLFKHNLKHHFSNLFVYV